MSMTGVDYSKRLADIRGGYHRELGRTREAYNHNLEEKEKAHESSQKKTSKDFENAKLKLEKDFSQSTQNIRNVTDKALEQKQETYEKVIDQERKDFAERTQEARGRFNDDIRTLNRSFATALRNEKEQNEALRDESQKVFDKKLTEQRLNHSRETSRTVARYNEQEAKNKIKQNEDRNRLIEGNKLKVEQISEDAQKNISEMRNSTNRRINELNRAHDDIIEGVEGSKKRVIEKKNRAFTNQIAENNKNYNNQMDKVSETNVEDRRRNFARFRATIDNKNRENTVEQEALRREIRNLKKIEGNKFAGPNIDDIQKNSYESTIESYKRELNRVNDKLSIQNERNRADIQRSLRDRSLQFSDRIEENNRGHAQFITKVQEENARVKDDLTNTYRTEAKANEKREFENSLRRQNLHKRQLQQQDQAFANQFNSQTNAFDAQIDSIRKQTAKDKTKFIQDTKERVAEDRNRLRTEFTNNIQKMEEKTESWVESLTGDYEERLVRKDDKIKSLEKKTQNMINYYNELMVNKEAEANRTLKKEITAAQAEGDQRVKEQKRDFTEKLKKMTHNNTIRIKKLTESYEGRIKNLQSDFAKRLRTKDEESKAFQEQIVNSNKLEREDLIAKYETRISDLKRIHEENMVELKDSLTQRNENIS